MKLIKAIYAPVLTQQGILFSTLNSSTKNGALFEWKDNRLALKNYSFESLIGSIYYENNWLLAYEQQNIINHTVEKVRHGQCYFRNEDGEKMELPEILTICLVSNITYLADPSPQFTFICSNFEKHAETKAYASLISFDPLNNTFKTVPFEQTSLSYIDGAMYAVGGRNEAKEVIRYNSSLEIEWRFSVKGDTPNTRFSQRPIENDKSIIVNLIAQRQGRRSIDGELFCLAKDDGSIIWRRKLPFTIQDCKRLSNNRLVIYTESNLHVLCPDTGETLKSVSTEFDVFPCSVHLFVYDSLLFVVNSKQSIIQIYDADSIQCIRKINVTEYGWLLTHRFKIVGDRIYLGISDKHIYPSLLIIDPADIQAPLEIEASPGFIFTSPSESQSHILIEIENISIDDLIRFGEATILEQIRDHGKNFFNNSPNKYFDGHALLKIKGLLNNTIEEVEEYLDMMVERVNFFAEQDGFRCGKGKKQGHMTLQVI